MVRLDLHHVWLGVSRGLNGSTQFPFNGDAAETAFGSGIHEAARFAGADLGMCPNISQAERQPMP